MQIFDPCDTAAFQIRRASIMSNSPIQLNFLLNDEFKTADNESTLEQLLPDVETEESSPLLYRRRSSSPICIPASPKSSNIVVDCNRHDRDAVSLYQSNSKRYISACCGIDRAPSDAWWALPDLRSSLKRHRQLLGPCPPRNAAITPNSRSSSRGSCS